MHFIRCFMYEVLAGFNFRFSDQLRIISEDRRGGGAGGEGRAGKGREGMLNRFNTIHVLVATVGFQTLLSASYILLVL